MNFLELLFTEIISLFLENTIENVNLKKKETVDAFFDYISRKRYST